MLKAILHGKAGRIEHNQNESVSWSSLFKAREDLLTSTIFERFAYLTDEVQQNMLLHWFKNGYGEALTGFGELSDITYWPRFIHEHDNGTNQVEPDLILHFEHCNLIVEVKPPAGGDQYFEQWQKEIESFIQSEQGQEKPLYFLAIGRISNTKTEQWANTLLKKDNSNLLKGIASLEWAVVTEHIVELSTKPKEPELIVSKQDLRVLMDILDGLSLYGLQISAFKWTQLINHKLPNLSLDHRLPLFFKE